MRGSLTILGTTLCLAWAACGPLQLEPKAYARWCQQHKAERAVKAQWGDYDLTWVHAPTPCQIILRQGPNLFPDDLKRQLAEEVNTEYYELWVTPAAERTWTPKEREMWAYQVKQRLYLLAGTDSTHCMLYHFEAGLGGTGTAKCLMAFEVKPGTPLKRTLVLKGNLGDTPELHIELPINSLRNLPTLKI